MAAAKYNVNKPVSRRFKRQSDRAMHRDIGDTAKLLPRLTLTFFDRPRLTALLWVALTLFGVISYTTLLKREGFPSVAIPIVIVNGTYAVNDPAKVDKSVAAPVSEIALKQDGVKTVIASSGANFFQATVQYDEKADARAAKQKLQEAVEQDSRIPDGAKLTFGAPYFGVTGGDVEKVDATISIYSTDSSAKLEDLVKDARQATRYFNAHKPPSVARFSVSEPFKPVVNPLTGKAATVQRTFDRYGVRMDGNNQFHNSVIINVASMTGADAIELDDQLQTLLKDYEETPEAAGVRTAISASYAPSVKEQISELQRVLLEGLLVILIVGSIIIAVRASLITVLSMITVIAATLGIIYVVGYSLNVITLFALILSLSLIVDDTIIMVEAIDSARRRTAYRREAVAQATAKISRAMTAATLTAALSFMPLAFVGGVLGTFIRAIPVTIISALLVSLLIALVFIPLFARYLLLGKRQMGNRGVAEPASKIEARIARAISRPMLWARHSRVKEVLVGLSAVLIGMAFIVAGGLVFQKVKFNIFPPTKDTNQLAITLTYPAGTSVQKAAVIAGQADEMTSQVLGDNFEYASYYGLANDQMATLFVQLKPYGERETTAPQMVQQLKEKFKDYDLAKVSSYTIDTGPPVSNFQVDITAGNRKAAERLAKDMAGYLKGLELKRLDGSTATITDAAVGNTDTYSRTGNRPIISVTANFDADDTTTLTTLAQSAVRKHYDEARLARFGLQKSDVNFYLGQESENQDSFKSLAYAFPLVLLAIYILLVIQFRSFLQPLLIFLAIPFSFFGISLGLFYTDNPFSFFAMLGFFALIGLSIKNTILLTDYANQARRAGLGPVDAAVAALGERFRPLVATSLTAVCSLIPLAVTSPFWQSLAVTLIFGLLSSTFLVITVFPYYYLGAEFLRIKTRRKKRRA